MNEEIFFVTIKKSRPLRNLKRAISRKFLLNNSSRFLEVNDQMVVFSHDIIAHHINLDGFYEKEELEFIFSWFETLNTSTKEKLFNGNAVWHRTFFSSNFLVPDMRPLEHQLLYPHLPDNRRLILHV